MFSVVDTENEAYLEYTKVNVRWQAGQATDAEYLTALQVYADSYDADTPEYLNAQERVKEAKYNINRNRILSNIDRGTQSLDDLLAFDAQAMLDTEPGNQEFRTRRDRLNETTNKDAYAHFSKVKEKWDAGQVNDATYLAAFQTYVGALTNPDDKQSAQLALDAARYTLGRNAIVNQINKGNQPIGDLLAYDQQSLAAGVTPGSEEYRQRLGRLQETQRAVFSEQENDKHLAWQQGTLTTTQLLSWYQDAVTSDLASGNNDLTERIQGQIDTLKLRVRDERDSKVVDDFNNGVMGANAFLAYAKDARDRYATNTPEFRDWQNRIDDATKRTTEDNLLYRYNLTNQYADYKRFVQTHKKAPWEAGGTSEDTRWILGDDGKWKAVTTTTTTPYTPSQDQLDAWKEVQAQVAQARAQMTYIEQQIGTVPGGWVDNDHMLNYYSGIQNDYVAGSSEWYQVQQKIDQVHEALSQDQVYKTIGVTVNYPWTPTDPQVPGAGNNNGNHQGNNGNNQGNHNNGNNQANQPNLPGQQSDPDGFRGKNADQWEATHQPHPTTSTPNGPRITIDDFLRSLGQHESNGSYNAQNPTTGAFGKYQHLTQFWPSRALRYLGNANAPMTPENQEKVTRGMVQALYNKWGDWRMVALAWHNGHVSSTDPADWNIRNQKYVNRIMKNLGSDMWTPTTTQGVYASDEWTAGGGTPDYNPPAHTGNNGNRNNPPATNGNGNNPPADSPPAADNPPAETSGPKFLLRYNGQNTKLPGAPGEHAGPTRTPWTAVGVPSWATDNSLAGTNWSTFYNRFVDAYRNGQESVIFTVNGKQITYSIPANTKDRQAMMSKLDQLNVDLYANMSSAYWTAGNTDLAREADGKYQGALDDAGQNVLIGMTQPGGYGADDTNGVNQNPIADASAYIAASQKYIDGQTKIAQAAFDQGNYSLALAAVQRAQARYGVMGQHVNEFLAQAEQLTSSVEGSGIATAIPASVQTKLDALRTWNTSIDLGDLDKLATTLVGSQTSQGILAGQWRNGIFVPTIDPANGNATIRPDLRRVLGVDANGNVKVTTEPVVPPHLGADGKPMGVPKDGMVPVTYKVGNTVETVWAKAEETQVGKFSDGTPIYGRAVFDPTTKQWINENPFSPGTWSTTSIDFTLPPGAQVVPNPNDPNNGTKTTITFQDNQGKWWTLAPTSDGTGAYLVYQPGQNQPAYRTDSTSFDVNAVMSGFNRDLSLVAPNLRGHTDTTGPVFGMSPQEYDIFLGITKPASPTYASPDAADRNRAATATAVAPKTDYSSPMPDYVTANIAKTPVVTPPPISTFASPDAADRNKPTVAQTTTVAKPAKATKAATVPVVTPPPIVKTPKPKDLDTYSRTNSYLE